MRPYQEWIFKAENELKSALKLSQGTDAILDTAIYHTEECACKALKGFLIYYGRESDAEQDLKNLFDTCRKIDPSFDRIKREASLLSPYRTVYQYPDQELLPDGQEINEALTAARLILAFVHTKLK